MVSQPARPWRSQHHHRSGDHSDLRLACTPAFTLVCDELATRNGISHTGYSINDPMPEDAVVIGFAADLPPEAVIFARSPMAIGVWAEKSGTLENACGEVDPACLVEPRPALLGSTSAVRLTGERYGWGWLIPKPASPTRKRGS